MYTDIDFETKSALRAAVKAAQAGGRPVTAFQPGGIFPGKRDGEATIEGPHYPRPHRWYARVILREGCVVKVVA